MAKFHSGDLALVSVPKAFLYDSPDPSTGPQSDEVLSGWAVKTTGPEENDWVSVITHYGYRGYIRTEALIPVSRDEIVKRQERGVYRVSAPWMDLYGEHSVQGFLKTSLPRGSFVTRTEEDPRDGWVEVRTGTGLTGWVHQMDLAERMDQDGFLLQEDESDYFHRLAGETISRRGEEALRKAAVQSAMAYLGTPYRWGGKTQEGIDCSGLAFMSWMENGILIYRDAHLLPEYPVREIPKEKIREGDLIFFPGHVAVCLGNGKYIHATAYAKTPWVTVNSLNPEDPEYREDLAKGITGCGTVFGE